MPRALFKLSILAHTIKVHRAIVQWAFDIPHTSPEGRRPYLKTMELTNRVISSKGRGESNRYVT